MYGKRTVAAAAAIIAIVSAQYAAAADVSPQAVGCKPIRNVAQLQSIAAGPFGSYCLANDIDAGSVANFMPIPFGGKFFGNGHAIRNLTVNTAGNAALFGHVVGGAVIQDLSLVNVNIASTGNSANAGGLVGNVIGQAAIARVHVSGQVTCSGDDCNAGGIGGWLSSGQTTLTESSSSADVTGPEAGVAIGRVGGAVGVANAIAGTTITRTTATGNVRCGATLCLAGGLAGHSSGLVDRSSASGAVTVAGGGRAGGLLGSVDGAVVRRSHASGPVNGGMTADTGGLIGLVDDATIEESYSIGRVSGGSGANIGGLIGNVAGAPTFTNIYWDRQTSNQMTSAAGLQFSTNEFRAEMPAGFGADWAFTKGRSYPFLNDADIDLTLPLATLIRKFRVFAFLPIGQLDDSQYAATPANADGAALATVYTMIARAIGITRKVAALDGVTIDYFWNDATQIAKWKGPVVNKATLGTLTDIPANAKLNNSNVIGAMRDGNLVILRGSVPSGGGSITHWMLATLYTLDSDGKIAAVVAHDPWTGQQVTIDPKTRKVVSPGDYPLSKFKVDGYQPVTLH